MQQLGGFRIARRPPGRSVISLVPMIDVLMILLVFFMVTSTYLNLDMIPAVERAESAAAPSNSGPAGTPLLLRIGADGVATVRGQPLPPAALGQLLADRITENPTLAVLVLPSGAADMQALVSVMDTAAQSGVSNLRVIRLEAQP